MPSGLLGKPEAKLNGLNPPKITGGDGKLLKQRLDEQGHEIVQKILEWQFAGGDEKLVCVPADSVFPYYSNVTEKDDLPGIVMEQIEHFFPHYKDLEKKKWVRVGTWGGAEDAKRITIEAIERYQAGKKAA